MKKFRLIREYPGSPNLNTIYVNDCQIENYPEFWEEIVEKDYEILALKRLDDNSVACIKDCKIVDIFIKNMPENQLTIHSVKRLSDGEIFTVGDNVIGNSTNKKYNISSFVIEKRFGKIIINGHDVHLNECKKAKQPLFTTIDDIDIFEDDEVTWLFGDRLEIAGTRKAQATMIKSLKYFSTKEKAEEYILMNKPCLSLNDLKNLSIFNDTSHCERIWITIKELVKSKL